MMLSRIIRKSKVSCSSTCWWVLVLRRWNYWSAVSVFTCLYEPFSSLSFELFVDVDVGIWPAVIITAPLSSCKPLLSIVAAYLCVYLPRDCVCGLCVWDCLYFSFFILHLCWMFVFLLSASLDTFISFISVSVYIPHQSLCIPSSLSLCLI